MIARYRLSKILKKIEKSLTKTDKQRKLAKELNQINSFLYFNGIIKLLKEERDYYQNQINKIIS